MTAPYTLPALPYPLTRARLMVVTLFELTSGTCGFVMAAAVALRVD